jgi:diguanylate cyclase (GGDEF)-like protein/PAS domain S-box-containing protein
MRVLIAEDVATDAELQVRLLERAGLCVVPRIVDSEKAFTAALREFAPDVILSDFAMNGFDGMAALSIARAIAPHTPFVFVSGTIGEEYAIGAVKAGATDYVLKSNLLRLPGAVERAVAEVTARRERLRAEAELEIARERLREREAGLVRAQLMAKLAHVVTRPDGSFASWSETLPRLVGLDAAAMPRSTRAWLDLLHPDDRARFRQKSIEAATSGTRADIEYRLRRADGAWIDLRQATEPMPGEPDAQGRRRWFSTLQDITEQKQAEEKIKRLNRVYAVLSGINSLIVRVRGRDELFREACRIALELGKLRLVYIGLVDAEAQRIRPIAWAGDDAEYARLDRPLHPASAGQPENRASMAVRTKLPAIRNDIRADSRGMAHPDEALKRGYRSAAALPLLVGDKAIGVLGLFAGEPGYFDAEEVKLLQGLAGDISFALEHIEKQERLDYLAYYDSLTGLANRGLLQDRLEQHVREAARAKQRPAVIVFDIERFSVINDTFGRQAGDALLKQMGARLLKVSGDAGVLGRLGADHFALAIAHVELERDLVRTVEGVRERILGEPFSVGGAELRIAVKAGIALFPSDGSDAESLLRNAEAALRKAKARGERYLFYTQQMAERIGERLALENKLRQALEKGEFVLHYQPKVDLQTRSIVGVEALIRWQSPELGLVAPMKFIPLLEETGLILEVGAWALNRAALDHRSWVEKRLKAPRIAVNVSAIQLRQREFVAKLERAIMGGVAPVGVDLEITESLIMEDIEATIEKLENARELGVHTAIDDFGTGYSSLAYLAKLPVDSLKIDRSFIITMLDDPNIMTLTSSIISLAHSLKLKVVAEGVDSEDQANVLRLLRCDEMQGYLYSKPLPVEQLVALLQR